MFKICTKCKRSLPLSEFNWKIKNVKYSVHCRICSREYVRQHYLKNRNYYLTKAKKRNAKIFKQAKIIIANYFLSHSCVDCGEKDLLVLEFDHVDRNKKDGDVSQIIKNTSSLKLLLKEIKKCEVRCANCHRRKTAKENNSWKLKWAPVA